MGTPETLEPSPEEKIRQMKAAGFTPPQKPGTEPSYDEKIRIMQAAGYVPQEQQAPGKIESFLSQHPTIKSGVDTVIGDLPILGGGAAGALGMGVGTGLLGPGAGTALGAVYGASVGGEVGSYAKDELNAFIYGRKKDFMQEHQDAVAEGNTAGYGTMFGEGIGAIVGKAGTAVMATKAGSKVGALISGVSDEVVSTYAAAANRIKEALASKNGSTFRMAVPAREQYIKDLIQTRTSLGQGITEAIKGSTETVDAAPIIADLERSRDLLNPKIDGPKIAEIQGLINKTKAMANMPLPKEGVMTSAEDLAAFIAQRKGAAQVTSQDAGKMTLQEVNQLKLHFQDVADTAYGNADASVAAKAAKDAGRVTREVMNKVAPDEVISANAKLSRLHVIEDSMQKTLLKPRGGTRGIIDAGTDSTGKNAADLQDMQQITGTNMTGPAQDIAAANAFGKYKFSPSIKGMGQPTVKAMIDSASAAAVGQSAIPPTLGQAVMHGQGAQNALKTFGGQQQ